MLRTLAFVGVAAVAYKQLKNSGAIDRFKDDVKARAEELKAKRATGDVDPSTSGAPSEAGFSTATI